MELVADQGNNSVSVMVYVQPKAKRNTIVGLYNNCLKLSVTSPPVDGKANKEVVQLLSKLFNVPKTKIIIKRGAHSRTKQIIVGSVTLKQVQRCIEENLR